MFQLQFWPSFARQKKLFLAESGISRTHLPQSVQACVDGMVSSVRSRRALTAGDLWSDSFRAVKPLIIQAALVSMISSACAAFSSLVAMRILRADSSTSSLYTLCALWFGMNLFSQFGFFLSNRLRGWVGLGVESYLAGLISQKVLRLSALAALKQSTGNLKVLITSDVKNVAQFWEQLVRNLIPAIAALVVAGPILVHLTGKAGLIGVLTMGLAIPISVGLNHISIKLQEKSQTELDSLTTLVGEWVKNIRLIRYLSWDEAFRKSISNGLRKFMTVSVYQHFLACLIFGLSVSWWMVSVLGVVLAARYFHVALDVGAFFGALWLLTFISNYFTHLPYTIRVYAQAAPSVKRIVNVLKEEEQEDFLAQGLAIALQSKPLKIIFENVGFSYPKGEPVLKNLSFECSFSKRTALIGEVASGKTTLLKLLCGEFPPTEGTIHVEFEGGQRENLWTRDVYPRYRSNLTFVPQDAFVSSDLLHANISLEDIHSGEAVLEAAYWAELEADIQEFPQGIDQEIGESGVNLSGGQRQRLNLARAYHFARAGRDFMILDDTLSAVDSKTEKVLVDRLINRGRGCMLATHRISEIRKVDEIWVLNDGTLVERGGPRELENKETSHFSRIMRAYVNEVANV